MSTKGLTVFLLILFFVSITLITGCSPKQKGLHDASYSRGKDYKTLILDPNTVSTIRSFAIAQNSLNEEEKNLILNTPPRWAAYPQGGKYGDFYWYWKSSTKRKIEIEYSGNLEAIDHAKLRLKFLAEN
jgi:hypothetical protein